MIDLLFIADENTRKKGYIILAVIFAIIIILVLMFVLKEDKSVDTSSKCFKTNGESIIEYYKYEKNNTTNKKCPKEVYIPETINNKNITIIEKNAFKNKNIEYIMLNYKIDTIKKGAFYKSNTSNKSLKTIVNPGKNKFDWYNIINTETDSAIFSHGLVKNREGNINIKSINNGPV